MLKKLSAIFMDVATLPHHMLNQFVNIETMSKPKKAAIYTATAAVALGPVAAFGSVAGIGAIYAVSAVAAGLEYYVDKGFRNPDPLKSVMPRTVAAFKPAAI